MTKCIVLLFIVEKKNYLRYFSGRERERKRARGGGEFYNDLVRLEDSVVVGMASVGVSSHQGRAYGAQLEPHQLLHSSGAAGLLPRPLCPRYRTFSGQDASGRWRRLVWVELGMRLGFKHWI